MRAGSLVSAITTARRAEVARDFGKAYGLYDAIEKQPEMLGVGMAGKVRILSSQGNYARAIEMATEFIDAGNPFQFEVRLARTEAWIKSGDREKCVKELERIERIDATHPEVVFQRGLLAFENKEYLSARTLFTRAVKTDDKHLRARFHLGKVLMQLASYDQAIAEFNILLDGYPNQVEFLGYLGDSLLAVRRYKDAIDAYRRILKENPASGLAYERLADVEVEKSNLDGGIDLYRQSLEFDSMRSTASLKLAKVYERKNRYPEARIELQKAIARAPGNESLAQEFVAVLEKERRFDQAGIFLKTFHERFAENTWAFVRYTRMLLALDENKEAKSVVERHIAQRREQSLETVLLTAEVYRRNEDYAKALAILEDANKTWPDTDLVLFNMAVIKDLDQKNKEALDAYAKVPPSSSLYSKAVVNTALVHERMGKADVALRILQGVELPGADGMLVRAKIKELAMSMERNPASAEGKAKK